MFEFDASEIGNNAMMYQDYEGFMGGGEDFACVDSGVLSAIEERKAAREESEGETNTAIKSLDKLMEGAEVTQRGEYW